LRRAAGTGAALLTLVAFGLAHAGEPPGAARPPAPPAATPAPPAPEPAPVVAAPAPDPAGADPAWRDYDDAFRALAAGHVAEARRLIAGLVERQPRHPAAVRGQVLLRAWGTARPASGPSPALTPPRSLSEPPEDEASGETERPGRGSRAELAFFETLHGVAFGLEVCALTQCRDGGAILGLPLLFGSAGLTATLLSTSGGVGAGTVASLEAGVAWGSWNAAAIGVIRDLRSTEVGGLLMAAQALGLGAGGALAATLHPTGGQVSLANSVGLWSGALMLFARGTTNFHGGDASVLKTLLVATDVALPAGALVAAAFPISRGHALLIDSGGVGGALLGMGAVALIGGDSAHRSTYFKAMIPATLLGLAAATFWTRRWDGPEPLAAVPVSLMITPPLDGHGATAGLAGTF
jgi:hypothetical protein